MDVPGINVGENEKKIRGLAPYVLQIILGMGEIDHFILFVNLDLFLTLVILFLKPWKYLKFLADFDYIFTFSPCSP